jgi:energy-coupling factor transport system substrate-specific component
MRAVVTMWSNTRMIALVPVVAALYAAAEVALAPVSIVLIPGIVQFRASSILTMLLGLLFGPAGAWGVAIGNTVGDYFTGSLALGSFFGFWSSFIVPYFGYIGLSLLLDRRKSDAERWSRVRVIGLIVIALLAAPVSAVVLAWGLEVLGIAPFQVIANILVANFAIGDVIGVGLFLLLGPRVRRLGATWTEIMSPEEVRGPRTRQAGVALMAIGGLVGWTLGALLGLTGGTLVLATGACLACIVLGAVLS